MEASTETAGGLEQEIEELTERETFDPPEEFVQNALISDESVHEEADKDPVAWWAEQAKDLHWFEEPTEALDDSNPPFYKWFADGKLNASYNCLDRHVEEGNGDRVALIWRGEEGEERQFTYSDLLADTKRLANALTDKGVEKGDVVGIYLPMIPEVVVSMLACARIGAPHNVVFGGFSPGLGVRAHGGLRGQGADHDQLRPPQGQVGRGQVRDRRPDGQHAHGRDRHRGAQHRRGRAHAGRARPLVGRRAGGRRRRARGRGASTPRLRCSSSTRRAPPPSRRASCTPPGAT